MTKRVYLSSAPDDRAAADEVEAVVRACGFPVTRGRDLTPFGGVTDPQRQAVDEATVFLAVATPGYLEPHVCQWEFTRAVLAAQRLGDPGRRIIAVGSEPTGVATAVSLDQAAEAVAAGCAEPLGGAAVESLCRPRRFVGRYSELWRVHTSPSPTAVVGSPGSGKSALAEQYGVLFRTAYPGGVESISLAGADLLAWYAADLRAIARRRFGVDLADLGFDDARDTVADLCTAAGQDVCWILDGVPPGFPAERLVLPSPRVRTLLTTTSSSGFAQVGLAERCVEPVEPNPVLAFAAALDSIPFPGDLLAEGAASPLGSRAPMVVAEVLDGGVLHPVDQTDSAGRQLWRLHPGAAAEIRRTAGAAAERAAVVLGRAVADPSVDLTVLRHAVHVAKSVPARTGEPLLRVVAERLEERGDTAAAYTVRSSLGDNLAAARLALAAGDATAVLQHAALLNGDSVTEHRARYLTAAAHDLANTSCPVFDEWEVEPVWATESERFSMALTRVRALRRRGHYRPARELVEELIPRIERTSPTPSHKGEWPVAAIEHAHLLSLTGYVDAACAQASEVLSVFETARLSRHRLAQEARRILATHDPDVQPKRWSFRGIFH